ncbi:Rof/RNase P-like protein [Phaeosphaeria sp. MPI-PUGE-AT-0046c]|nr:Rof/RNase P-like protein [Phaeosphaeria sp. MPI-PUGE-AT-0046c]
MTESQGPPFGQALLERAFSPDTAASHYTERAVKRPLTIRATSPTPSARAVRRRTLNERKDRQRKHNKQKPRPLSAAEKRKLCLNEIPKDQQRYAIYKPLHDLWLGYMREVLGVDDPKRGAYLTPASSGQLLATADMHGALLSVMRSRCVSRVGLEGIVVRDTRFTFEIITRKNVLKSIPKEHTIFRFEIPLLGGEERKPLTFELFGEQFQTRAADRANKKFRMHYQPDL